MLKQQEAKLMQVSILSAAQVDTDVTLQGHQGMFLTPSSMLHCLFDIKGTRSVQVKY